MAVLGDVHKNIKKSRAKSQSRKNRRSRIQEIGDRKEELGKRNQEIGNRK